MPYGRRTQGATSVVKRSVYRRYNGYRPKSRRVYRKTTVRKPARARRTYKRTSRTYKSDNGPKPDRQGVPIKVLRQLCKENEDVLVMYTDSSVAVSPATDATSVSDYQLLHATDIQALYNKIPVPATNAGSQSLIIKSATHMCTFSNFAQQTVDVTLWLVRAKRDLPAVSTNTQLMRPSACWQMGVEGSNYGAQPTAPSAAMGVNHPYSQPSDSVLFNKYWYTKKKYTFQLLPGGTRNVTYTVPGLPAKVTSGVDASPNQIGGTKGLTHAMLWQFRGAMQTTNSGSGNPQPQYSRVYVGIIENKRYKYTYAADNTKQIGYSTNWGGSNITVPDYINPVSGVESIIPLPVSVTNLVTISNAVDGTGKPIPLTVQGTGSKSLATAVGTTTTA